MKPLKINMDKLTLVNDKDIEISNLSLTTISKRLTPFIISFDYRNRDQTKRFDYSITNINKSIRFSMIEIEVIMYDNVTDECFKLYMSYKISSGKFTASIDGSFIHREITRDNIPELLTAIMDAYL